MNDIGLTEDNELLIINGDLAIIDSRYQHAKHLFEAEKGYYKFSPESGVGMSNLINDEVDSEELLRMVRFELERDGFNITKLLLTNDGKIDLDGDY